MYELSTAVTPAAQEQATANDTNALGGFLAGLGALITPVANTVAAVQSAKNQNTTNTGDPAKNPPPTLNTGVAPLANTSNNTLLIVGLGGLALVAVLFVATRGR